MDEVVIDPFIGGRSVPSFDRSMLVSVHGRRLADVGMAPRLLAQAALDELDSNADGLPPAQEIFHKAAWLFANEKLNSETVDRYLLNVTSGTGLTTATVRRGVEDLVTEIEALPQIMKAELPGCDFGPGFQTRWVPRGKVFVGVMASNHPVPNMSWIQALFHGYSVLVRPGSRDPFTAWRLVGALQKAGLPGKKIAFVPCSHAVGDFLLGRADRGIVYGGDQAVAAWQRHETVAVRGPGRTKALLDVEPNDEIMDHLAESAAFDGGTRCTNLSAVLTTWPVEDIADRLAERLSALPLLAATDPSATLLVADRGRAERLRRQVADLRAQLIDHTARYVGEDWLVELDDGSFLLRPLVLSADRADHPAVGTELPFPFLVVAPWSEQDGFAPLSHSLVLNLLTDREKLVDQAVREPSVRKVTRGTVLPWTAVPGIPHDGNYTGFLLEPKGVVSAPTR
jgi:acyl-CoA reductase-like NAD-dependent aldehyde dehydrogenase